jgi:hypothetical protein
LVVVCVVCVVSGWLGVVVVVVLCVCCCAIAGSCEVVVVVVWLCAIALTERAAAKAAPARIVPIFLNAIVVSRPQPKRVASLKSVVLMQLS